MRDIFANIVNGETFVEASLVQDIRDPQSVLTMKYGMRVPNGS